KVYSSENLRASWEKVRSNGGAAGVDRQSIEAYEKEAEKNLVELEKILREGSYRAKPVKRVWIPKIGSKEERPLGVPASLYVSPYSDVPSFWKISFRIKR
ncbi:MAG: hypothetical protein QG591_1319, partial [Planctomycetota bacterium]|nr:hypothetical protein [Planctomycetota bacterium]